MNKTSKRFQPSKLSRVVVPVLLGLLLFLLAATMVLLILASVGLISVP